MASVNMAIVVGFVGDDPRINQTQSGRKVASFSLATTEKGYTTQSGQQIPDRTEWHNIVCWGKTAEVIEKFVRKGSSLYIQGKIRTRSYEKDGQTRYVTEIECETMQILDRRAESQQSQSQGTSQYPMQGGTSFPHAQEQKKDDEDLPF